MYYHQRPSFTPEQREANHRGMFRCIVITFILCTVLALISLATGCQRKAYAPKHNPKPRPIGLIRDREEPRPRYSVATWADDTTTH